MGTEATVLAEDTCTKRGFIGEHGFSVLVRNPSGSVLFDTGAGAALLHNAERVGADLKGIKALVLSHGHNDHTGGLESLLLHRGETKIIACPGLFGRKHRIADGEEPEYIGIPRPVEWYTQFGARFTWIETPTEVLEGVWATGPVPRETDFEGIEPTLFLKDVDNQYVPDTVPDDQSLIVRTGSSLSVILGCAHAGIINILRYATKITGIGSIDAVIGGPHLLKSSDSAVERVASELRTLGVRRLALCHCVGTRQGHLLFNSFGSQVVPCETGTQFDIH